MSGWSLDAEVLFVDCQTTGATPERGALIELGLGRAAEVRSLRLRLPEGATVPRPITRVTGLSDADLADGVDGAEACAALLEACGGAVACVAHYARFEARFLEDLCARHGPGGLPLELRCTHAIARRLLPDLPRRGLHAVAGYLGHGVPPLRRSGDHVRATAFVWRALVARLAERGVTSSADLDRFLALPPAPAGRVYPMPREDRLALPDRPGVYRIERVNGDLLYVGKATSLRKRVNSHFQKRSGLGDRTLEMLSQARRVRFTETASALEAALLESDAIKREAPPYNRALVADARSAWFCDASLADPRTTPDDCHRVGPIPTADALASYRALRHVLRGADADEAAVRAVLGWGPERGPSADVFREGLARFRRAHGGRSLPVLGRAIAGPDPTYGVDAPWDAERVLEGLCRVVRQGTSTLRRARWLTRLTESSVAFEQDGRRRLLTIRGGRVEGADLPPGQEAPVPPRWRRGRRARQADIDLPTYDRLRVLTTELRRLPPGAVEVRLGPSGRVRGSSVARLMRCV